MNPAKMPQTKIVPKHPQVNNTIHLWEFVTLKSPSPLQTKKQKFISTEPNNFSNPISDSSVTSPSSFLASAFGFPQQKAQFFFFFFFGARGVREKRMEKLFRVKIWWEILMDNWLTLQNVIVIKWWNGLKSIMLEPGLKYWLAEKVSLKSTCLIYK